MTNLKSFYFCANLLFQLGFTFNYDELSKPTQSRISKLRPSVFSTRFYTELFSPSGPETYITSLQQENEVVQIVFNNNEETDPDAADAFVDAALFWNNILGDTLLGSVTTGNTNPVEFCDLDPDDFPDVPNTFDTIIIAAQTVFIDGAGSTLAQAGPCASAGGFPRIGVMSFDSADLQGLIDDGSLGIVIRHEMGHVIGIGTFWEDAGVIANPCTSFNPCNTNPTYVGENGVEGFNDLGGTGDLLIADQGGQGTANGHWR
eukprot:augustus_masked-scaffold_10-processed-gene-11.50-mRNA-1 protein AED:0.19 eAED:0.20 QI:0/-1/0/1/-1/1/1/0/259